MDQAMAKKQTTPKVVRQYMVASRKLRKDFEDPKKAGAFLVKTGLAEKSKSSPNGITLAKRYR